LLIPFIGGVLIDRYDRRYLGIALDLARGVAVLATAYVAWHGHLELWHLYLITLITGTGSAMYWANVNALGAGSDPGKSVYRRQCRVVIGVQTGMLFAGALVGFIYDKAALPEFSASTASLISSPRGACTKSGRVTSRLAIISQNIRGNFPPRPKRPGGAGNRGNA